jgi:hypothetical protein
MLLWFNEQANLEPINKSEGFTNREGEWGAQSKNERGQIML